MQSRTHINKARFIQLFICFLALSSSCLFAQKLPEIDLYGGYSYVRFNSPSLGFSSYSNLNGYSASITAPHLYEQLGLTFNGSGAYGSELTVYNFLLGPQFTFDRGRIRFFGNALFGKGEAKVQTKTTTRNEIASQGFAAAVGGGVDINIARRIAVRAIDIDYVHMKTFGNTQNTLRISAGVVYQFGRK
jgi:hypothetical protein